MSETNTSVMDEVETWMPKVRDNDLWRNNEARANEIERVGTGAIHVGDTAHCLVRDEYCWRFPGRCWWPQEYATRAEAKAALWKQAVSAIAFAAARAGDV